MKRLTRAALLSRYHAVGLMAFTVAVVVLAGCRTEETGDGPAADHHYRMGAPITDARNALIITSDFGSDTLTTALFRQQYQQFVDQIPQVALDEVQGRELRRGIAEEFIRRHALFGEANSRGLTADTAAVEAQLGMILANVGGQEELDKRLAARNMTMDSLRNSLAEELRLQTLQEQMAEEAVEPTDDQLEAFRQEQAEQVRAQHILFRVPDPAQKADVIAQATAVLDSIKAGADFGAMAARYGTDGTAQRGGDLGFFSRSEMVDPFSKAAFALSDSGDVASDLVETQFGYHIIRLSGRRTVEPMEAQQAQMMLMRERQQVAYDQAFNRLLAAVTIRVNADVLNVDLNEDLNP